MEMNITSITVNEGTFHIMDIGEGDTVLFLNDIHDYSSIWFNQVHHIIDNGYRAIIYDFQHAETCAENSKPKNALMQHLIALEGLLNTYLLDSVHIVGHGSGAILGWFFAMFNPHRVNQLIAISGGCVAPHGTDEITSGSCPAHHRHMRDYIDSVEDLALNKKQFVIPPVFSIVGENDKRPVLFREMFHSHHCGKEGASLRLENSGFYVQYDAPFTLNKLIMQKLTKYPQSLSDYLVE